MSQSTIDWNRGITVQILARHHQIPTSIGWAHNLLEIEPTNLARYDYRPKPAGWGNGGGGLEPDDLKNLARLFPDHPIFTDTTLTDDEKLIIAGGIREFLSETGYRDFDIITDYPGVFLYDYKYRDWVDAKGVLYPGGHRKITLWGQVNSYKVYDKDWVEKHEVDKTDWFDMADPLPKYFYNPITHPDRPYWSHVRYSLISLLRIYGYQKANSDYPIPNIPTRIHPSWWYIFKVGRGDPRFPAEGYKLSPSQWYRLFDIMVAKRMEIADYDFLSDFLGDKLINARRSEEERSKDSEVQDTSQETTLVVEDSEDSDGIPTVEEMREKEDEEYARWFERELDYVH
jgi:hypothetical protein